MSNKHMGSRFDDFLEDEGMLEEATAVALKRVIALQIAQEMKAQNLTKTTLAKRMHTSRAALNRLLDEEDSSLTLTTLASAAAALGKTVSLHLAPADGPRSGPARSRPPGKATAGARAPAAAVTAPKRATPVRRGT